MFGSQLSRTGLLVAFSGLAVLGASYYAWSNTRPFHGFYGTRDSYQWVPADSSSDSAIETDEVWQASATCQLPYFIAATLRAKAKLNAFYDAAPEEIRDWRARPARLIARAPTDEAAFQNPLRREQAELERSIAEADYESRLHAKYMEWYVTASKLEQQAKEWEWRLSSVSDQRMTLGEARRNNLGLRSGNGIGQVAATANSEQHTLSLLGLGGFPKDQLQALKTKCVEIIPVKKIFTPARLWHWPVDRLGSFTFGLELVFVGLLFGPISKWVGAGGAVTDWRHVRQTVQRLVMTAGILLRSRLAFIAHASRRRLGKAAKRFVMRAYGLRRSETALAARKMWPHVREATKRVLLTVRNPFGDKSDAIVLKPYEGAGHQVLHRSRAASYRRASHGYERRRPSRLLQR